MSYEDHQQRVTFYLPRGLYNSLLLAAADAGESVRVSIISRLASSLTIPSQTAARSGCAGRGEAAVSASPELGS
jgi:hypothetical protein